MDPRTGRFPKRLRGSGAECYEAVKSAGFDNYVARKSEERPLLWGSVVTENMGWDHTVLAIPWIELSLVLMDLNYSNASYKL
jgi:hypothetical protein